MSVYFVSFLLCFCTFGCDALHLKKDENNGLGFLKWLAEGNLVANNIDNRIFLSRNYLSDTYPSEIRGTFPREASICLKSIKFRRGNYHSIAPRQKRLNRNHELII